MADTIPSEGVPYQGAISGLESGGNYLSLGPTVRGGDKAYGKYQVMGNNIPSWTKEVLGFPMTPQQFLHDPQAQEQVFSAKFGQYVTKYGPEGAARAWIGGPGNVNNPNAQAHDVNGKPIGLTVGEYGRQFTQAMAPGLPSQTVGQAPPVAEPQPTAAPQLAAPLGAPQQPPQQQLPAGPGGGVGGLGASPQQPQIPSAQMQKLQSIIPQIQMAMAQRPQVNMQPLQNYLQGLPGPLGLPSQFKSLY